MTPRERILSIVVGGAVAGGGLWWAANQFTDARRQRQNEIQSLSDAEIRIQEQRLQGELANRRIGEYRKRSLPDRLETARGQYQAWLLDAVRKAGLRDASIDASGSRSIGDLYNVLNFRVGAKGDVESWPDFLNEFYSHGKLHRIRDFSLRKNRDGSFQFDLSVDAMAMKGVSEEMLASVGEVSSLQAIENTDETRRKILDRNLFSPPNRPPIFRGDSSLKVVKGKSEVFPLVFEDPEGDSVRYEWVSDEIDGIRFDEERGVIRVDGDLEDDISLTVRAIDTGYPSQQMEKTIAIRLTDPPPPTPEPPPPPKFDEAKQTVLTGLVRGREDWNAWLDVRTRGETLKLRPGDNIAIGSVEGTVTSIDSKSMTFQWDGKSKELKLNESLFDAVKSSSDEEGS
ncbi:MAG: hypothetical protein AAF664_13050 [Planctomycetota bacterium]